MKPFLQGRKTIAVTPLRLPPGGLHPRLSECAARTGPGEPKELPNASVEVVKEGDKVVRLLITCSCGEQIEVDCLYSAGS
jgi:hypothetical protein